MIQRPIAAAKCRAFIIRRNCKNVKYKSNTKRKVKKQSKKSNQNLTNVYKIDIIMLQFVVCMKEEKECCGEKNHIIRWTIT